MPELNTKLYLSQLKGRDPKVGLHGLQWGDPEKSRRLNYIKRKFIVPFIDSTHTALEIGPGGGRWTRYLLDFKKIYAVDYHQELLDELKKNYNKPNMVFIKNNGTDFPGIPENSIDYVFSFGVFVHLDLNIIEEYVKNLQTIIKPTTNIVIQYSDKTKKQAQLNATFSENYPEKMRQLVKNYDFKILDEDLTTLPHSSVIHFSQLSLQKSKTFSLKGGLQRGKTFSLKLLIRPYGKGPFGRT